MAEELTPELVLRAYASGIFPMGDDSGIKWYSPDPRCIFDLENFHIPTRLHRTYKKQIFELRVNTAWHNVIRLCAQQRNTTWITEDIVQVYTMLYQMGFAHSVEAFLENRLVGGLYGVSIGGAFMGESMFHLVTDASKICLVFLVERLRERKFTLLDSQYMTSHLSKFGALDIPRVDYLQRLRLALSLNCRFDR